MKPGLDPTQLAAAIEPCVPDGTKKFIIGQHWGMGKLIAEEPGHVSPLSIADCSSAGVPGWRSACWA